jgi:hypothetical protein
LRCYLKERTEKETYFLYSYHDLCKSEKQGMLSEPSRLQCSTHCRLVKSVLVIQHACICFAWCFLVTRLKYALFKQQQVPVSDRAGFLHAMLLC